MEGETENRATFGENISGATEGHETRTEKLRTTSSAEDQTSRSVSQTEPCTEKLQTTSSTEDQTSRSVQCITD